MKNFFLLGHAIVGDRAFEGSHLGGEWGGVFIQIDKQEAEPFFEPVAWQAALLAVEAACAFHTRRGQQVAIRRIRPGVVGTDEPARAARVLHQGHETVPADV